MWLAKLSKGAVEKKLIKRNITRDRCADSKQLC